MDNRNQGFRRTRKILTWSGIIIEAYSTAELAQEYFDQNGMGYMRVAGELIGEVSCDDNYKPDWNKYVDYTLEDQN